MRYFDKNSHLKTIQEMDDFLCYSKGSNRETFTSADDLRALNVDDSYKCKIISELLCYELSNAQDIDSTLLVIDKIIALSLVNNTFNLVIFRSALDWSFEPVDGARWKCLLEILRYDIDSTPEEIFQNGALRCYCKKIFSDLAKVNFAFFHDSPVTELENVIPILAIKQNLTLEDPYLQIFKEAFTESIKEYLTTLNSHHITDARSVVQGMKLLGNDFLIKFSDVIDKVIDIQPTEEADIFACAQAHGEFLYELHRITWPSDSKIDFINDMVDKILETETNASRARTISLLCFYASKEKSLLNLVLTAFFNRQEVLLKVDVMVIAETLRLLTENEGFDNDLSSHQCISFLIESFNKTNSKHNSLNVDHDIDVAQRFLFNLYSDVHEISPSLASAGVNWLFKTFKTFQDSDISDWNEIAGLIAEKNDETFFSCLFTTDKKNDTAVLYALIAAFTHNDIIPSQIFVENAASFIKKADTKAINAEDLENVQKRIKFLLSPRAYIQF